ncbi:hypothetical protein KP509_11G040000 [Ceratopteris richardii]|uniref:RING-type domain-containing protein n=1 Tax=Ceratopteris richardii TaxID=49495 RepID=A0A8T2TTS4_CERRI|nr:hypothetical protein KP509_11G040000 [Ceratopteris richardii]
MVNEPRHSADRRQGLSSAAVSGLGQKIVSLFSPIKKEGGMPRLAALLSCSVPPATPTGSSISCFSISYRPAGPRSLLICGSRSASFMQIEENGFPVTASHLSFEEMQIAEAYWRSVADESLHHGALIEQENFRSIVRSDLREEAEGSPMQISPSSTIIQCCSTPIDSRLCPDRNEGAMATSDCRRIALQNRRTHSWRLNTMLDDSPNLIQSYKERISRSSEFPLSKPVEAGNVSMPSSRLTERHAARSSTTLFSLIPRDIDIEMETSNKRSTTSVSLLTLLQQENVRCSFEYSAFQAALEALQEKDNEDDLEQAGKGLDESMISASHRNTDRAVPMLSCCICMTSPKGAALIPCGHTFCRACSRQLSSCPLCNITIIQVLDIF